MKNKLSMRKITITTLRRTLWVALLVAFSFCTFQAVAGVPRKMAYQIMALDPTTGQVLANRAVDIRIELRMDTAGNMVVWYQDFKAQTDEAGVCQLTLEFADYINWGIGNYYLATIINGKECSAPQITSVPYALYAQNAVQADNLKGLITSQELIGTWEYKNGEGTIYEYMFSSDNLVSECISIDIDNPGGGGYMGQSTTTYQWVLDAAGRLLIYKDNSIKGIYSVVKLSDTSIAFGDYIYQKQEK